MNLLKIDEAELKNQVENYHTLKITRSYRGVSVLIISAFLGFTLLLSFFGYTTTASAIGDIVIHLPILFFAYKGHRWALILLMALWTLSCGFAFVSQIDKGGASYIPFGMWFFFILVSWKALMVENERRKVAGDESV